MTQEDKELLLKDLCARLPYGVICRYKNENRPLFCVRPTQYYKIALDNAINVKHNGVENCVIEEVKPYLFPLSSMTAEQEEEFNSLFYRYHESAFIFNERFSYDRCSIKDIGFYPYYLQDWFNKNHFDYRGLIEKELALDATGLDIYK